MITQQTKCYAHTQEETDWACPLGKPKSKNAPGHHQRWVEERKLTQRKYWVSV